MNSEKKDDLTALTKIGDKTAELLNDLGIWRFEALLGYKPQQLLTLLKESGHLRNRLNLADIELLLLEAQSFVEEARDDGTELDDDFELFADFQAELSAWEPQAEFTLFFDKKVDEAGGASWRSRIYHEQPDESVELFGDDVAGWHAWIAQHAGLPEQLGANTAVSRPSAAHDPADAVVANQQVQIHNVDVLDRIYNSHLLTTVTFELVGDQAERLAKASTPFHIISFIRHAETEAIELVESDLKYLEPGKLSYESPHLCPVPPNGEYELETAVILHTAAKQTAYFSGPLLEIELA